MASDITSAPSAARQDGPLPIALLPCPKPACASASADGFPTIQALTLHLVEVHGRPHGEAFLEAGKVERARVAALSAPAAESTTVPPCAQQDEPRDERAPTAPTQPATVQRAARPQGDRRGKSISLPTE